MATVASQKISLLIADDHRVLLDGLVSLLKTENGFSITAALENGKAVIEFLHANEVDVCLLDISMPEMDGQETARWILANKPGTRVIILTTHDEDEFIAELLALGVSGYLLKSSSKHELVEGIKKVMSGKLALSDKVSESVIRGLKIRKEREDQSTQQVLTSREKEIVQLLAREFTNEKIARELQISIRTVETHRKNIMHKTGSHNLAGLIRYAYENKLIS